MGNRHHSKPPLIFLTKTATEGEEDKNNPAEGTPGALTKVTIADRTYQSATSKTTFQLRVSRDVWNIISELEPQVPKKPIMYSTDFVNVYQEIKQHYEDTLPNTELKARAFSTSSLN